VLFLVLLIKATLLMEENQPFSIKSRLESFGYAFRGIYILVKNEHNARVHLCAMIIVISIGFYVNINKIDWCLLIICIGMVIAAEAINGAIEYLADFVQPQFEPMIGKAKDLAAAAVLILSISAAIIGVLIFTPYLLKII
jgi:diacylglycerol kinase (ATP)